MSGNAGSVYLLHGSDEAFNPAFDLVDINQGKGIIIDGNEFREFAGSAVGSVGDFNADGYDDVIIGSRGKDVNNDPYGSVYVLYGYSDLIFKNSFED